MNTSASNPFDFDVSAWPALPPARGLLVTGTDTEVGKTLIAGAIARRLRGLGRAVEVFKPVATGCRRTPAGLVSDDAEFLAACAGSSRSPAEIAPLTYELPLAPNVAAEMEGRPVDLPAIFDGYRRIAADAEALIVEGIGGLLCPIAKDFWVIHLAKMLRLPLVIVARAGLGTINHTLLTLHAARSAALEVAGVVINRHARNAGQAMRTNPAQIAARGGAAVLAVVPDDPASSVERRVIGPAVQAAIDAVDWDALMPPVN